MGSAGNFLPSLGTGFHDFAGSTVVHTIGGFIALAGAIVLGPRLGRSFKRDGGGPMLPHDLTIAACGGLLLWFGWYGFNPGSTLSAMDFEGIGRVAANTTLAACAAGLTAMAVAYSLSKNWDISFTVNGFLAGLVAITCPCYWVSPTGSILLGGIAGVIVVGRRGTARVPANRRSDRRGAGARHLRHLGNALARTLRLRPVWRYRAVRRRQLGAAEGSVLRRRHAGADGAVHRQRDRHRRTFAVAMAVMKAVNAMGLLRVSTEGELHGLDLHEHGISAYPGVCHLRDGQAVRRRAAFHRRDGQRIAGIQGSSQPGELRPFHPNSDRAALLRSSGGPSHVYHFEFAPTNTPPRIRITEPHQMPACSSTRTTGFAGGTNNSHIPCPIIRVP